MYLYQVPRRSRVRVIDTGEEFNFDHIDGSYSYCTDDEGNVVHLTAWEEVTVVDQPFNVRPKKETQNDA
jgi:hypothetical protein